MKLKLFALLEWPYFPLLLSLLSFTLVLPSLWVGFQFDDYLLEQKIQTSSNLKEVLGGAFVFMDGDLLHTQMKMQVGDYPWWTLPEGRVAFWRPLSALTHWVDFRLWPGVPAVMHLQNVLWYVFGVYLAAILYKEFFPPRAAGLAALLFTIDDAHGYAVGWISNRNVLISFGFAILALTSHNHWRRKGKNFFIFLPALFFGFSLLSAEAGLACFGFLIAYTIWVENTSIQKRILSLLPYGLILLAWVWFYKSAGFGGWGTSYVDPLREPFDFLMAIIERAPVLWLGMLAYPPAELYPFVTNVWLKVLWLCAAVMIIGFAARFIICPVVQGNRQYQFWLTGAILSTIPVCSSLPANRLLFFIGLGLMPILADWLLRVNSFRPLKQIAILIHIVLAVMLLPFTTYSPKMFGNIEDAILSAPIKSTVVIVSAPSAFHADFFRLIRSRFGYDAPERVWYLGAELSSLSIERADEYTLVVDADDGYISGFDGVFRGGSHPLRGGERVDLNGMQVEVLKEAGGRPRQIEFRFGRPLENPEYQWLIWQNGKFVSFKIPSIGETLRLNVPR